MRLPFFLARRFVAGETLDETLEVVRRLDREGLRVALDRLGEHVHDREVARAATDHYVELIRRLGNERDLVELDVDVSIKCSMIGQVIDESFCREQLLRLLEAADRHDVFVTLDMEGSDLTRSTLRLFRAGHRSYPDSVGAVLQAYLKRTADDVATMCDLNARVRLCKGAYDEPPEIAHQEMEVIRDRFLEYARTLIAETPYPGIATHDETLIRAVQRFVEREGVDRDEFEFQMLYGIRRERQRELVQEGFNALVYVPYGSDWGPYFYRRLRERKENVWFVLRHLFGG